MKKLLKILPVFCVIGILLFTAAGCNIFSFTSDKEQTPVEKAEEAIREGNYEKAISELAESVKDSTYALALYLDAKATLLAAGVNIAKIVELIEGQNNVQKGDNLAILDMIDNLDLTEQTAWYRANIKVAANISRIWNEQTAGIITKDDIALDFSVSNVMSGVLGLRDTNRDYEIDENDFQLNLDFTSDTPTGGFQFAGVSDVIDPATGEPYEGLKVFLGGWETSKISASSDSPGYEPEDINELLAFFLSILDDGEKSIAYMFGFTEDTAFDTEEIQQYIIEMGAVINFYWYNDGIDNDGDGRVDEELIDGFDNDKDGLIDEDSDYTTIQMITDPNYNSFYDADKKENNTTGESRQYKPIFEAWILKALNR